jgi:hypothetical protein
MYTMEHYLAIKKDEIICRKMDGTGEPHVKQNMSSSEDKCYMLLICEI